MQKKVTGQQLFMNDLIIPGGLWAVVVRSPYARAEVLAIDTESTLRLPGVVGVFTADDVPDTKFNPAGAPPSVELAASADRRLLTKSVQHVGDGVAVVVATTQREAAAAASQVEVKWEILPPVLNPEKALMQGDILGRARLGGPEADKAFAAADLIVEEQFTTPAAQHICLEPHGCAALFDPIDNRLTIWSNTQAPSEIRRLCSEILDIPLIHLRMRKIDEGGGFGCKQELYEEALVAWLALQLRKPVHLLYTRLEEFTASRGRHGVRINVKLGFRQDGILLVSDVNALLDSGGYASHAPYVLSCLAAAGMGTYPNAVHRYNGVAVRTNTLPGGGYRGYGVSQACFAMEQAMDIAADQLGIDPVELRRRNIPLPDNNDPVSEGLAIGNLRECLEKGSNTFGDLGKKREICKDGLLRAAGVAVTAKGSVTSQDPYEASTAIVRLNEDGTATLVTGTCDSGTGSSTVLAQIVADELGISLDAVEVREGDTDSGLVDLGSYSQRTVHIGGGAARNASIAAREQILDAIASLVQRPKENLFIHNSHVIDCCDKNFQIPLHVFCQQLASQGNIIGSATYRPSSGISSYNVCFVGVAVNPETGVVHVERCVSVTDCGRVLNPLGAAGQVHGSVAQGIGFATIELWDPGPEGRGPSSIQEHGVPGALDVPYIEALFLDTPGVDGPYGARGMGETPIVPVAAAIANAVARATGTRFTNLPLRPANVWQCLQNYSNVQ